MNKRCGAGGAGGADVCLRCVTCDTGYFIRCGAIYSICSRMNVQKAIRIYYIWLPSNTPFMWWCLLAAADALHSCSLFSHCMRVRWMFNVRVSFVGYVCTYVRCGCVGVRGCRILLCVCVCRSKQSLCILAFAKCSPFLVDLFNHTLHCLLSKMTPRSSDIGSCPTVPGDARSSTYAYIRSHSSQHRNHVGRFGIFSMPTKKKNANRDK